MTTTEITSRDVLKKVIRQKRGYHVHVYCDGAYTGSLQLRNLH